MKNDAGGGRGEQGGMSTVDQDAKFTKTFPEKDGGVRHALLSVFVNLT